MKKSVKHYLDLEKKIGYEFRSQALITEALTHSSCLLGYNYERLEFLGDRVIGLLSSHHVFQQIGNPKELGKMATYYNYLVCTKTLAEVARRMQLEDQIQTGKCNVDLTDPILADICEAVMAAIYLDGGMSSAKRVFNNFWPLERSDYLSLEKDPKSRLQEWTQSLGLNLPKYSAEMIKGDPKPVFRIQLEVKGYKPVSAEAGSKQAAMQAVAETFIKQHLFDKKNSE